jgi:hypothetical protein
VNALRDMSMDDQVVFRAVPQARVLRVIYAVCLLAGMSTHIAALWRHGFLWDYGGVPLLTRVYWTSLTFLDPLAAMLLFVCPRTGLAVTLSIISTDVAHNVWFFERHHLPLNGAIAAQCAFLVFVLVTLPRVWRGVDSRPVTG